jgi:Protein of unknown function (DUF3558)
MRNGLRLQFSALVVAAITLTACGDDDGVGTSGAAESTEAEEAEESEEPRPSEEDGPWPDVDPCDLLPAEALRAAGIDDTDGESPSRSMFDGPHCAWGIPGRDYVNVVLSGPLTDIDVGASDGPYGQIAGRDAYFTVIGDELGCWMVVDNGGYKLEVSLYLEESQAEEVVVCEATEPLVEAALSTLE